jgi:hypothetical protein
MPIHPAALSPLQSYYAQKKVSALSATPVPPPAQVAPNPPKVAMPIKFGLAARLFSLLNKLSS